LGLVLIITGLGLYVWLRPKSFEPTPPSQGRPGQRIEIRTEDGFIIVGSLYKPRRWFRRIPAMVLLPPFGRTRHDYDALATDLQKAGIAVVSIDLRGQGESGELDSEAALSPESIARIPMDAKAALQFVFSQSWVDHHRVGILGSSFTANTAVVVAGMDRRIRTLILLSGDYSGRAREILANADFRPVLFAVSFSDPLAPQSKEAREINKNRESLLKVFWGTAHGTDLLSSGEGAELARLVVEWCQKYLR